MRKIRKRPIGRPLRYSPIIARRIYKVIREGASREAAAALAGIATSTLHDWRNNFSEFSDGIEKADAQHELDCIRIINKAGRDPRNWTAVCWKLERKHPERWGKVDRHLIRMQQTSAPLPKQFIDAINAALGIRGSFEPIGLLPSGGSNGGSNGSGGVIDTDALPQE